MLAAGHSQEVHAWRPGSCACCQVPGPTANSGKALRGVRILGSDTKQDKQSIGAVAPDLCCTITSTLQADRARDKVRAEAERARLAAQAEAAEAARARAEAAAAPVAELRGALQACRCGMPAVHMLVWFVDCTYAAMLP